MSRPLFAVSEDVYLTGSGCGCDGPATVLEVDTDDVGEHCLGRSGYILTIPIPPGSGVDSSWCECALRKRYPPADSFESIMDGLREKIPA